jgi:catechol 2,3-dioxygenase-like lactoylglutathione lyase family enzyme
MKLQKVYHMGIPVDNLNRARDFYANVLGMEYLGRVGGNPNNPDALPVHGVVQKLDRFRCGTTTSSCSSVPRRSVGMRSIRMALRTRPLTWPGKITTRH